jgi:hypothetical protein
MVAGTPTGRGVDRSGCLTLAVTFVVPGASIRARPARRTCGARGSALSKVIAMFLLLVCALTVLVGAVLLIAMFGRDDAFVGLIGLSVMLGAGVFGAIYAALES